MNDKKSFISIIVGVVALVGLAVIAISIWAAKLDRTIQQKMSGQRWASPSEFFSAPERFIKGQSSASLTLSETLKRLDYSERPAAAIQLRPGQFSRWNSDQCRDRVKAGVAAEVTVCWAIAPRARMDLLAQGERTAPPRPLQIIAVSGDDIIYEVYEGNPPVPVSVVGLEPELFAQFYGGQAVMRKIIPLGDAPAHLLNAIIAIEDNDFLNHGGISVTGMLRAAYRNIRHHGVSEGGSTLTQQLIKNYFLTSERTFKRKITEILMAILLESRFTKDDILETYINEVYLGQAGPFEIHGMGSAAQYYFKKPVTDLELPECAMLAGLIQSPNRLNPFKYPQRMLARRTLVLKRMLDLQFVAEDEYKEAMAAPLPTESGNVLHDQAPFFVDAVHYQLKKLGIEENEGLRVYTTLNIRAQRAATMAVAAGVQALESKYDFIQKAEQKSGEKLQGALISGDPTNGFVEAVVGGSDYHETQLNRAVVSHRQVGSVFKPFVYLDAFLSVDPDGNPYTPLTPVLDAPFTAVYDKKEWSPQNYDNEYMGNVTLFQALEHSLNAATVKVALQVGLQKIADLAAKVGVDTKLAALPSLALGTAELSPMEVLQAYNTLARRGELNPLTFIYRVVDISGKNLYQFVPARSQVVDPIAVAETIGLMQGVVERGTGRSIRPLGFTHPAAGKTGTTSDTKDAWFAGFTPLHSAVVWVGFDKPEQTGLTGGLAAVPIWTAYMKAYASRYPPLDFTLPDGAVSVEIDSDSMMVAKESCPNKVRLVFKQGQQPTATCWLNH